MSLQSLNKPTSYPMKKIPLLYTILLYLTLTCSHAVHDKHAKQSFHQAIANAQYAHLDTSKKLRYTHFESPMPEKEGTIVFIQGRGTFLEYHEELVTEFLIRGYDVWMYDLLGQGLSTHLVHDDPNNIYDYRKQYIDDFSTYVDNLDTFLTTIVHPIPGKPTLLGGYSTGAHIVIRYLQERPNNILGAFAVSPIINYSTNFMVKQLVRTMAFLSPQGYTLGFGPEDPVFQTDAETNGYTSDPDGFMEIADLVRSHPEQASVGGTTWGWLSASMKSCEILKHANNLQQIQIPLAIFAGLKDTVIDNTRNHDVIRTIESVHYFEYPEGRHELFRETPALRQQFWSDLDHFLERLSTPTVNTTCALHKKGSTTN